MGSDINKLPKVLPKEDDRIKNAPQGHSLKTWFEHDSKGMAASCGCGWKFPGVFSSPQKAIDKWYEHAREFDGNRIAEQIRQRDETARKAQEIVAMFKKNRM